MYAVVNIAGEQVRAEPGERIRVPRLPLQAGTTKNFSEVYLMSDRQGDVCVGTPYIDGASVRTTVVEHGRSDKIEVFKMKRRKGYRRRNGHRQCYTEIQVDDILRSQTQQPESPN